MWILFAVLAALSAAIVTVLTKAGLKNTDSNLAFAIQSVLILIVTWTLVLVQGTTGKLKELGKREWIYLVTAGILTACSSLFTFRALKLGDASAVTPIERSSLLFTIILAGLFLKERITWQMIAGGVLILGGAVLISVSKKA
jgi:transporter family protein